MYKPVKAEARALRRYNADLVLDSISKASTWRRRDEVGFAKALERENIDYKAAFRDCQLAFVAKLALYVYNKPRLSQRQFTWKDLLEASRVLIKHQVPSSYPIESTEDLERFLIRVAYQQFPDFYGDADTLARTSLLFRTSARTVEAKLAFDIDAAYKEATGLTLDESWDISLAICGLLLTNGGGIQQGPLRVGDLKQNISELSLSRFFDMVSLTPDEFRQQMDLPLYRVDPFETFNPNPLVNWPIVKLSNNRWVVPIFPYLFRRGTEQAFYDVIRCKGREFSGYFGYVFEDYCDRILTTLGTSYEIIGGKRYTCDGRTYDTCDRIIVKDDNAVLIECKTKRLNLRTKFSADKELLRYDLTDVGKVDDKSNVVSAIRQLYRTERDIRANCPGLEGLYQKIRGKMFPLVLVLDPYYLCNAPYIGQIIKEELGKGSPTIEGYNWQIVSARDFEQLCSLARLEDFINLVAKKFESIEFQLQEMDTFVQNYKLDGRQVDGDVLLHPIITTELDGFRKNLAARYGIKLKGK